MEVVEREVLQLALTLARRSFSPSACRAYPLLHLLRATPLVFNVYNKEEATMETHYCRETVQRRWWEPRNQRKHCRVR